MKNSISGWVQVRITRYKFAQDLYSEGSSGIVEMKSQLFSVLPYWVAGAVTALVATMYDRIFLFFEHYSIGLYEHLGYGILAVVPVLFFLSWYTVERFSPYAGGSGIPQLMVAAELSQSTTKDAIIDRLLEFRVIIVKIVSSLVMVLGGGAIGREGPTLQISGAIFHLIGGVFNRLQEKKSRYGFVLAGGAAGLASAFNTPLGGIAYVIEELSKSHLSLFRAGVLHSVIVAGLIAQLIMGPYLYLGYPKASVFQYSQLGVVLGLAIASGLLVALFGQSLKKFVEYRSTLNTFKQKAFFTLLSGFIFALLILLISPMGMGSGKELLNRVLFEGRQVQVLEVIARFFGSLLTYAAGGAGGIFAPTLSIGGALSSYLDHLAGAHLGPLATLIGMAAGLSALTHSPLTSFILILEMTDRHSAIFPLMIAAVIGHSVSKAISKQSFYEFVYERLMSSFMQQDKPVPPPLGEKNG